MDYKITILGRFPGMNELIASNRVNKYKGNSLKQTYQRVAESAIFEQIKQKGINIPLTLEYAFYEPNMRRDKDNISAFAHKVIQDALVSTGVIPNDGWAQIEGYIDKFYIDKNRPRIEVILHEPS